MADFLFKSMQGDAFYLQEDLARLIVSVLKLEMDATEIDPHAPLFNDGLGLDSIDALEIAVSVSERYRVQLRSDDPNNKHVFASLHNLAQHIAALLPPAAEFLSPPAGASLQP